MSDYQRVGCPLRQYRWPYSGRGKWIVWNWTTGVWDVRDEPVEIKR